MRLKKSLGGRPPIIHFGRTATQDYQLRDKTILEGQSVALYYTPRRIATKKSSKIRGPSRSIASRYRHIGFGVGEHFCLGASSCSNGDGGRLPPPSSANRRNRASRGPVDRLHSRPRWRREAPPRFGTSSSLRSRSSDALRVAECDWFAPASPEWGLPLLRQARRTPSSYCVEIGDAWRLIGVDS